MENLGNGTISIGCSRGKEEKRKRRRVPVDITLARRRDVLQPRRGAHAGFIGRREREREREGGGRLCPRAVGDSKSGSAIISEGESEIRSSNRISRGQTLSVTKPASILGYRCPFNVSDPGSKETSSL